MCTICVLDDEETWACFGLHEPCPAHYRLRHLIRGCFGSYAEMTLHRLHICILECMRKFHMD